MVGGCLRPRSWMATSISRQSAGCRSEVSVRKAGEAGGDDVETGGIVCGQQFAARCCSRLFKRPTHTCALLTRAGIRQELTGSIPATSVALANPAASRLNGRRSWVGTARGRNRPGLLSLVEVAGMAAYGWSTAMGPGEVERRRQRRSVGPRAWL
jgi:hypothetical protein